MAVQPFQFEPERIIRDEDTEEEDDDDDVGDAQNSEEARVGHNSWCLCSKCGPMATAKESVCCKELNFLSGNVQGKHLYQTRFYNKPIQYKLFNILIVCQCHPLSDI